MAITRVARLAFNRGLISRLGLARADIKRTAMAAEIQVNWAPRVLGSMMLRPGLGYLFDSLGDQQAFHIPFIFSITDKALIEITNTVMRVIVDDAVITRGSVSSAITNGTFDTDLSSWTDADETGATSAWVSGGYMGLTGTGTNYAIRRQGVTLSGADYGQEHALHVIVNRGPVLLRVGASAGDDSFIREVSLETGVHSIAFVPIGTSFWVEFKSLLQRIIRVDSVAIESAGAMTLEVPWIEPDLRSLRFDQSGDVLFIACAKAGGNIGYQQRRIERRATNSWSVVLYAPTDGPFLTENVSPTTLTASAISGNITITASKPLFRSEHVGALFQHVSIGQTVTVTITAENTFSDPIRITGSDNTRIFTVEITGLSATGSTVYLQRSVGAVGNWEDVTTGATPWVADYGPTNYDDGLDGNIIYYRIGVRTGDYVAGTIVCTLVSIIGNITGVVRVTDYTNSTVVGAEVITTLGNTHATDVWSEGQWSDLRGYPTSVSFHEGRLGWSGRDAIVLSISDAFDGFDPNFEGDAGPINRSIGSGPVDSIEWMASLQRLLLGGQGSEFSVKSSSFDEILTPTNFNIKAVSTQGSAAVGAVKIDQFCLFVQRGGARVYELAVGQTTGDYEPTHLSALVPEIGMPEIVRMVVQRQPDTRVHCLRSDGTVALLVFDKVEQVICWSEIETDGEVEDIVVLPGDPGEAEDWVYYSVKRTINSVEKRFLEKWAFEDECHGDEQLCKLADAFVTYTGAGTTTITAAHLAGENVVVWADGADIGTASDGTQTYTLDGSGQATVPTPVTNYVVGLAYSAPWQSAKLVEIMAEPSGSFNDQQQLKSIGFILADVHAKGLKYGHNLTEADMQDLPGTFEGAVVADNTVHTDMTTDPIAFPGRWSADARACLLAKAPRPCTVMAAIAELEFHG